MRLVAVGCATLVLATGFLALAPSTSATTTLNPCATVLEPVARDVRDANDLAGHSVSTTGRIVAWQFTPMQWNPETGKWDGRLNLVETVCSLLDQLLPCMKAKIADGGDPVDCL